MKKVLTLIIMLLVLSPMMVFAKEDKKVTVYVFYGETCPHCHEFFKFLDSIEKEYGKYYQVKKIETWNDSINKEMMFEIAESIEVEYNKEDMGVPYIVINDQTFIGYAPVYNSEIKDAIKSAYEDDNYTDRVINIYNKYEQRRKNENFIYYSAIIGLVLITCVAVYIKEKKDLKFAK